VVELRTVSTGDGRGLEVLTAGRPDGLPWLWIPGTPSAAVSFPPLESRADEMGLWLVTWSRPGYGASSPRPFGAFGPRVADDVPDIEAVLDALDVDRFITVGWSGGGPRALACAALLPRRCAAAATLAGVAPFGVPELDWTAGMAPDNVADFEVAVRHPEDYAAFQEKNFLPLLDLGADQMVEGMAGFLTPTDAAAFTGDVAQWLTESTHRAGAQGVAGLHDDGLAIVAPWGFDVRDIAVPTAVWAGGQDVMVPFAHGRWLAEHIPGAVAHLIDAEGHITLLHRLDEVLAELMRLADFPRRSTRADRPALIDPR
jgi:pimeloyl-ACP methyl ester carboxylesterase